VLVSPPIVYVDCSEVRQGNLEELKRAITDLVRHVESNRGRLLSYGVYLADERSTMTVVHVHPDIASLELLMDVLAPVLPPFRSLVRLLTIDVYGRPTSTALAQLQRKVELLGGTVTVHEQLAAIDWRGVPERTRTSDL
jgi:hypothetical protein